MPSFTLSPDDRRTYLRFCDLALPRHTSYPTVPAWTTGFTGADLAAEVRGIPSHGNGLSLYVHVPFCEKLCYYCACTREIIPSSRRSQCDPAEAFLDHLAIEAERWKPMLASVPVRQVHLGGGSPTFLSSTQLERLWSILTGCFAIDHSAEIAIEVDPRITRYDQLRRLRQLGFNRVSLGVQDFDARVQQAVNRNQPFDLVARMVSWCRVLEFSSISFDLIYGLPYQTLASMERTLDLVLALEPDRVSFYRLAVIPEMFQWQKAFSRADLPSRELSLDLNLMAINRFIESGYEFIGLDHFARHGDSLARALGDGTLRRNFQGMTTGRDLEILGLGPSAISQLACAYAQNAKTTVQWQSLVSAAPATVRGLRLSADDCLRRELLQDLYCYGLVDKRRLERRFAIDFDTIFAEEMTRLDELEEIGLVWRDADHIGVTTPLGRLLLRVVAAVFDRYLPPEAYRTGIEPQLASKVG